VYNMLDEDRYRLKHTVLTRNLKRKVLC